MTQTGVSPDVVLSDNGGEFQGIWDWCKARNISVIKTYSHSPTENPVERSNKQLRALLSRLFTVRGNKRWIGSLSEITGTLRNTYNGNIKALPLQVWTAEKRKVVLSQPAVDRHLLWCVHIA